MNERIFARVLESDGSEVNNVIIERVAPDRFDITPFDRETAMTAYRDRVAIVRANPDSQEVVAVDLDQSIIIEI